MGLCKKCNEDMTNRHMYAQMELLLSAYKNLSTKFVHFSNKVTTFTHYQ